MARGRKPKTGRNTSPNKTPTRQPQRKPQRKRFSRVKRKLNVNSNVNIPETRARVEVDSIHQPLDQPLDQPLESAPAQIPASNDSSFSSSESSQKNGNSSNQGPLSVSDHGGNSDAPGGNKCDMDVADATTDSSDILPEGIKQQRGVPMSPEMDADILSNQIPVSSGGEIVMEPGSTTGQISVPFNDALPIHQSPHTDNDELILSEEVRIQNEEDNLIEQPLKYQEEVNLSTDTSCTVFINTSSGEVNMIEGTPVQLRQPSPGPSTSTPASLISGVSGMRNTSEGVEQTALGRLLTDTLNYLRLLLPSHWVPIIKDGAIHVGLVAQSKVFIIQRSLRFSPDGTLHASVHGKDLPPGNKFWDSVTRMELTPDSVKDFSENIVRMVNLFRQYEICAAVQHYESTWKKAPYSSIDENNFHETRYARTCRSNSCLLLVPGLKIRRCEECSKLDKILAKRSKRASNDPSTPSKNKPHEDLDTPEKKKRLARQSIEIKKLQQTNKRQKKRIEQLMAQDGVKVDGTLSDDFAAILQSAEGLSDFQKLFIEQQLKAASVKRSCGMRWHPALIRLALSLRMASPAAYEELSGVLKLPSERQLFDYSHVMSAEEGVHSDIVNEIGEDVSKQAKYPYQFFHVLSLDEVHLKTNLVFNKKTGELVGYVKLDPVETEMMKIERLLTAKADDTTVPPSTTPPFADKLLCYMVKGVGNDVKSVVACFGSANMNKESLFRKTWDVIAACELALVKIIAVVCDGAGVNRGFIQMHTPITTTKSGTVYDTINRYSTDQRPLYFLTDPPHLLKTLRNCLYSSGKPSKSKKKKEKGECVRSMQKNGERMLWGTIIHLYDELKANTIRTVFKLNQEDVYLTSYSRMSVSKAAHVLSRSVATALRTRGWENSSELATFCERCNDMFDMLNGNHHYHGSRTRNAFFDPYEKMDDPRFQKLEDTWRYFEEWKEQIQKQKVSAAEKARRLISAESYQGAERTLKGFCGAVKYLLSLHRDGDPPIKINARVFSQDDLEHYFGKLRARFGGNRHPNLQEALQAHATIHVTSKLGLKGRKRGNTAAEKTVSVAELSGPLKKRKKWTRLVK